MVIIVRRDAAYLEHFHDSLMWHKDFLIILHRIYNKVQVYT